jgi:hypothetical protein
MPKAGSIFMEYFGQPLATSKVGKDSIFLGAVSGCRIESMRVGTSDLFRSDIRWSPHLMPEIMEEVLRKYWGFDTFLPLQKQAMECVCCGRDSIVVLPTGGGKSLCFQAHAR